MSKIECHSDVENRWHAEILYSLFKLKVTLAELQGIAAQVRSPPATVFKNQRYFEIFEALHEPGMIDELPELAERCALMPELLEGGDSLDPDTAFRHLITCCVLQDMIAQGKAERTGPPIRQWCDRRRRQTAGAVEARRISAGFLICLSGIWQ